MLLCFNSAKSLLEVNVVKVENEIQSMLSVFLLIFYLLSFGAQAKLVAKTINLSTFNKEGPFLFVTKFHIGAGHGHIDVTYKKGDQIESEAFFDSIAIGAVNASVYSQFTSAATCQEKDRLIFRKEKFYFKEEKHGMKRINIFDLPEEQLWYFYIFSCAKGLESLNQSKEVIELTVSVLNNSSHFGQNDQILPAYIIMFLVWGGIVIRFAMPMITLLNLDNPNTLKLIIFGGLILLGTGYFYRLIHLVLYSLDGSGIHVFEIFYVVLKNIGEAIITTTIVSISWGWSVIHMNSNQTYIIIGVLSGIINTVSIILSSLTDEHQQVFHHYETVPGIIILILRVGIFLVFAGGILQSLKTSHGKKIFFIRKLGIIGGSYLLCWPITVLIVQNCFPNYMHREIITFIQQTVHICACTLLCSMIASPESAYRKVSLHEDDNPLGMKQYEK